MAVSDTLAVDWREIEWFNYLGTTEEAFRCGYYSCNNLPDAQYRTDEQIRELLPARPSINRRMHVVEWKYINDKVADIQANFIKGFRAGAQDTETRKYLNRLGIETNIGSYTRDREREWFSSYAVHDGQPGSRIIMAYEWCRDSLVHDWIIGECFAFADEGERALFEIRFR